MATLISKSPEETLALGEQWGRGAQRGWVIGLSGDLGAGKTQFVKGFARGIGSPARVHSPTFALLNEYGGGRLQLFHLDLYRLSGLDEVRGAGLEEYLTNPDGVTVVEWIDRWLSGSGPLPPGSTELIRILRFEVLDETERRIMYEDPGA
jgi:tRNA threonylcarbamoyladenosine biosynthesis protein TsaE